MQEIRLARGMWKVDESQLLGEPGGFGTVYAGTGPDGSPVAIKLIRPEIAGAAKRELSIAEALAGQALPHVIPVLDAGVDRASGRVCVVMAKAEHSLEEYAAGTGPVRESEAVSILSAIVAGLVEIGGLVHRDLKPANVLWHGNNWKLADMGIAKLLEDATSSQTVRDWISPQYAAPEQWRGERATKATDVYALGCVAHFLTAGRPPFEAPTRDELMGLHLFAEPPVLPVSPALSLLIAGCLRKVPVVRPALGSVEMQLKEIGTEAQFIGAGSLAEVAFEVTRETEAKHIAREREQQARQMRQEAAKAGIESLRVLMELLLAEIDSGSKGVASPIPALREETIGGGRVLGSGMFAYWVLFPFFEHDVFDEFDYDLLACAHIRVQHTREDSRTEYGANLIFANMEGQGGFRWLEVAFRRRPEHGNGPHLPFGARDGGDRGSLIAGLANRGQWTLAFGPEPVDFERSTAFRARWKELLVLAARDRLLEHPLFG